MLYTEGNEEKTAGSFIELDHTNNTNDTVTININEEQKYTASEGHNA